MLCGMRYEPREVFKEFHTVDWVRAILLCHRRAGKTYSAVAELLKRSYNGPSDGQYLFISPLAEQSMANTIGMFQRFDDEGYIVRFPAGVNQRCIAAVLGRPKGLALFSWYRTVR